MAEFHFRRRVLATLANSLQVIKRQILAKGVFESGERGSSVRWLGRGRELKGVTPTLSPFCNLNFHEQVPPFVAVVLLVVVVVAIAPAPLCNPYSPSIIVSLPSLLVAPSLSLGTAFALTVFNLLGRL